jgi:hypothetical protein
MCKARRHTKLTNHRAVNKRHRQRIDSLFLVVLSVPVLCLLPIHGDSQILADLLFDALDRKFEPQNSGLLEAPKVLKCWIELNDEAHGEY